MDEPTRRAHDGIARAVAGRSPEGPIVLADEYLRALERVERLPVNRPGADKSWTERALFSWMSAVARARRVPPE
ncbi:MAG: hypothetical protein E2O39_16425 [Planctomycetota bacterium]|nr:MAG: hypothetical protein E2O39_16425 [Planctomycetota bacterium]